MPVPLFLDTEWADADGRELVSLALVSEDVKHVFYAERNPLPNAELSALERILSPAEIASAKLAAEIHTSASH